MGTRADFYKGEGLNAQWIGSIAWDGYPSGLEDTGILESRTLREFRDAVRKLEKREDWTAPRDGWPWPWNDSRTTDYAYAWIRGAVRVSCFGRPWMTASKARKLERNRKDWPKGRAPTFPDMKTNKRVTFGARSGLMVFGPAIKE
jgi:hypothetical protein